MQRRTGFFEWMLNCRSPLSRVVRPIMKRILTLLVAFLLLGLPACERHNADLEEMNAILNGAPDPGSAERSKIIPSEVDKLTLYSLECDFDRDSLAGDEALLHGYLVLGKIDIDSDSTRTRILNAVRQDIANGTIAFNCIDPHHAITYSTGDTTTDVLLCYCCRAYESTVDGQLVTLSIPMGIDARETLNTTLRDHGVALSAGATKELDP